MIVTLLCALAAAVVAVGVTCGYVMIFAVRTEEERLHDIYRAKRQLDAERAEQLAAANRYVRHWRPEP